ncbi:uncharacterized protein EI90DRAFT_3126409 [Cantharellus anzutake]|uniref:uncharacterized protein n=1 Tax=Cantharellus anzutake TaxID=1750568 RepID=UPI0019039738|nr:uncharacterized protein EI90DRAFT_3126409 [Cantharellus anzutake]KAF8328249.1 hypothetical protein EI90DRAFT_3126409 [Cantharellus anzutake]
MDLLNDTDTQAFVYAAAFKSPSNAPHVPENYVGAVSSIFCVMERVNLSTKSRSVTPPLALRAPSSSRCRDLSNRSKERTLTRKVAKSRLFVRKAAIPSLFRQLQLAISLHRRACLRATDKHDSPRSSGRTLPLWVKILDGRVVTAQGDIKPPNFLIDPQTLQVTIIDFGGISALSHSFVSFTVPHCRVFALESVLFGDGSGYRVVLAKTGPGQEFW